MSDCTLRANGANDINLVRSCSRNSLNSAEKVKQMLKSFSGIMVVISLSEFRRFFYYNYYASQEGRVECITSNIYVCYVIAKDFYCCSDGKDSENY